MSEQKSSFKFLEFKILKSEIDFVSISDTDFDIDIAPSGTYRTSTKTYILKLMIKATDKMNVQVIKVLAESQFLFEEDLHGEIPAYFTLNAPAISFPYVRSYVAALSALSGVGTLNLPILNLVDLAERLKKNFEVID